MTVAGFSSGNANPSFADAVLVDIRFIDPVKPNADVSFQNFGIIVRAIGIG